MAKTIKTQKSVKISPTYPPISASVLVGNVTKVDISNGSIFLEEKIFNYFVDLSLSDYNIYKHKSNNPDNCKSNYR